MLPLSEKVKDRRCVRKTSEGNLPERVGKKTNVGERWQICQIWSWFRYGYDCYSNWNGTLAFDDFILLWRNRIDAGVCVLWFSQKHQSINGQHFNISSITQLNMQPKHQHELHLLRTTLKPGSSENYKIIFNMMLCLTLYVPCSTVSHIFLFCYNPPLNQALIWFSLIQAEHL